MVILITLMQIQELNKPELPLMFKIIDWFFILLLVPTTYIAKFKNPKAAYVSLLLMIGRLDEKMFCNTSTFQSEGAPLQIWSILIILVPLCSCQFLVVKLF